MAATIPNGQMSPFNKVLLLLSIEIDLVRLVLEAMNSPIVCAALVSFNRIEHLSYIENIRICDCMKIDHSFQDKIEYVTSRFVSIEPVSVFI